MAKQLKKIFIPTTDEVVQNFKIQSWHVSQSVDAFTGADAYDIDLSGSLTVEGPVNLTDLETTTGQTGVLVLDGNSVKKQTIALGVDGTSGSSGTSGLSGTSGSSGQSITGSPGTSGSSGISGTSGSSGVNGVTGTDGTSGSSGISGTSGSSGVSGTSGSSGTNGADGVPGTSGSSGTSGAANGTMGFTDPGSLTTITIDDYYYFYDSAGGATDMDLTGVAGELVFGNGDITVNNADVTLVTEIRVSNNDPDGNNIASFFENLSPGSTIILGQTNGVTPHVEKYIITANKIFVSTGPGGNVAHYRLPVVWKEKVSGTTSNWIVSNLDTYEMNCVYNQSVSTGWERYTFVWGNTLDGSQQVDNYILPIRFTPNSTNNVGDISIIEFSGDSTNNDGAYPQLADIQNYTVSASGVILNSRVNSIQNNFDTGSGFVTLMTAQSASNMGFVLLGNNQYV